MSHQKKLDKWHLKTCKEMAKRVESKELKKYYKLLVIYYKIKLNKI